MQLDLCGKIALITAASEGLGFACGERLLNEGCSVALCGRREIELNRAVKKLKTTGGDVFGICADISHLKGINNVVSKTLDYFGHIDLLVANSGHVDYGSFDDLSEDQWNFAYNLLLMSVVRLIRLCLPSMRKNGAGDIVILGSSTSKEPTPNLLLSTVMRLGVAGLAKSLALSIAKENIRINLVATGYFDTGRISKRIRNLMSESTITQIDAEMKVSGDLPIGRIGYANELAALVAFTLSRNAGFMTGSTLIIDGGGTRSL
jgi:3-oxoacyl-[acyl-carrier protein] reductase